MLNVLEVENDMVGTGAHVRVFSTVGRLQMSLPPTPSNPPFFPLPSSLLNVLEVQDALVGTGAHVQVFSTAGRLHKSLLPSPSPCARPPSPY